MVEAAHGSTRQGSPSNQIRDTYTIQARENAVGRDIKIPLLE